MLEKLPPTTALPDCNMVTYWFEAPVVAIPEPIGERLFDVRSICTTMLEYKRLAQRKSPTKYATLWRRVSYRAGGAASAAGGREQYLAPGAIAIEVTVLDSKIPMPVGWKVPYSPSSSSSICTRERRRKSDLVDRVQATPRCQMRAENVVDCTSPNDENLEPPTVVFESTN